MPDFNENLTESHQLREEARALTDDSKRKQLQFVETELNLGMTFAETALVSFSAGASTKPSKTHGMRKLLIGLLKGS